MTSRQITVIALKCLAVYLLFSLAMVYPHWFMFFWHRLTTRLPWGESLAVTVAGIVLSGAVVVGFALLAWRLAHGLAMVAVAPPVDEVRLAVSPRRLEEIGFRVLGVYFVVTRLPTLMQTFGYWLSAGAAGLDVRETPWHMAAIMAVLVFGLLVSLWPGALVDGLNRIANGSPPDETDGSDEPSEPLPRDGSDGPRV